MSSEMHFEAPFSFEKTLHIIKAVARSQSQNEELLRLMDENRFEDLIRKEWVPCDDYVRDKGDRQLLALFSKNAALPLGIDVNKVAFEKFLSCEVRNLQTNRRFSSSSLRCSDVSLLYRVQRKIAGILGVFPGMEELLGGFGPGASIGVSRLTSLRRKLSTSPTVTTDCSKFLPELRELLPLWHWLENPTIVDHGKLQFVPKTATTSRPIVVEPLVNTFLQKGVGSYIRGKLKLRGIDLDNQGINQELAREGSRDGSFATLDLASASDTIARCVVAELLPYDWWSYLDSIRTPVVKLPDGRFLYQQKFSSMGNGFTFELESLIFYAICSTICEGKTVSVYGDDLIVPTDCAAAVIEGLVYFGFEVNTKKSFVDGPFRESCGRDFLRGLDLRPCYLKGCFSVKELFRFHNFFQRKMEWDTARLILSYIPRRFRIYGPDGYGDGHLINTNLQTRDWGRPYRRKDGWCGMKFQTYQQEPNIVHGTLSGDMAARLWKCEQRASQDVFQVSWRKLPKKWWVNPSGILWRESETRDGFYAERGSTRYRLVEIYTLN